MLPILGLTQANTRSQLLEHVSFSLSPSIAVQRDDVSENPNRGDCK